MVRGWDVAKCLLFGKKGGMSRGSLDEDGRLMGRGYPRDCDAAWDPMRWSLIKKAEGLGASEVWILDTCRFQ